MSKKKKLLLAVLAALQMTIVVAVVKHVFTEAEPRAKHAQTRAECERNAVVAGLAYGSYDCSKSR
jgi:hypothetical protein